MYDNDDAYYNDCKEICGYCNGSGEGMFDGSTCSHCKGSGCEPVADDRDYEGEAMDKAWDERHDN